MILLSILTAQHSILAYLIERPSMILYVYVYLDDPKKHSHHVDIRNINNNNNNNNSNNKIKQNFIHRFKKKNRLFTDSKI